MTFLASTFVASSLLGSGLDQETTEYNEEWPQVYFQLTQNQ